MSITTAKPFDTEYQAPKTKTNYFQMKEEGEYLIRILTTPSEVISYFVEFIKNSEGNFERIPTPDPGDGSIARRPTWAFLIWNQDLQCVQIWECATKSIQDYLMTIVRSKMKNKSDWTKFDVAITRKGKTMNDTKYTFMSDENSELSESIQIEIANKITKINMLSLLTTESPFIED